MDHAHTHFFFGLVKDPFTGFWIWVSKDIDEQFTNCPESVLVGRLLATCYPDGRDASGTIDIHNTNQKTFKKCIDTGVPFDYCYRVKSVYLCCRCLLPSMSQARLLHVPTAGIIVKKTFQVCKNKQRLYPFPKLHKLSQVMPIYMDPRM